MEKNQKPKTPVCLDALSNEAKQTERALSDLTQHTPGTTKKVTISQVEPKTTNTIKNDLGIDVNAYNHEVDNHAVRHALVKHSKDPIPLTKGDITLIPDIIKNADNFEYAGKTRQGLDGYRYTKKYNGITYYVEEIRTGNKTLSMSTMYKTKTSGASSASAKPTVLLRLPQNEVTTPTGIDLTLSKNNGLVNAPSTQGATTQKGTKPPLTTRKAIEGISANYTRQL